MVLKYKGYNGNWCYKYTSDKNGVASITVAQLNVTNTIDLVKKRFNKVMDTSDEELAFFNACDSDISSYIFEQTRASQAEGLIFLVGNTAVDKLDVVTVVMFNDGSPTIVLNKEAYLMTDDGKTIEKLR